MGNVFSACNNSSGGGSASNTAISSDGMATGSFKDIDDAALQAIKNGIGRTCKDSLK